MYGPIRGRAAARASPFGKPPQEAGEEVLQEEEVAPEGVLEAESLEEALQALEGGAASGDKLDGSWTCKSCNNVNYRHREVCNTRKCALPRYMGDSTLEGHPEGSWLCVACNNINYKHRMTCHTRKCGMPFPGLAAQPQNWAGMQGPMQMRMPMAQMAAMCGPPAAMMRMWSQGPEPPNGSWRCPNCDNLNYASRQVCNTRKCQMPRPGGNGCGGGGFHCLPARVPAAFQGRAMAAAGPPKEGSWTCGACGNVNYGFREVCNTRKCQAPRPF